MSDTSIRNLLTDRVVEHLVTEMIDLVNDNTELGLARAGRLQDDPTVKKLNLLVREGDKDWSDCVLPDGYRIKAMPYEIGGGEYWLRRFVAYYTLFYIGEATRDEARSRTNVILSRFKSKIYSVSFADLVDSFGEGAIMVQVVDEERSEGGGPSNSFIWRCKHKFEFLTSA